MEKIPQLQSWLEFHYGSDLILAVIYGSHIYGTATITSDIDLMIVLKDTYGPIESGETTILNDEKCGALDITPYLDTEFRKGIVDHVPHILEAIFVPAQYVIVGDQRPYVSLFTCYPPSIRNTYGAECRQSWNRGVKKLTREKDPHEHYIGKKSLYHALKGFLFAKQLHETGYIQFEDPRVKEITAWYRSIRDLPVSDLVDGDRLRDQYVKVYTEADREFRRIPNEEQYNQQQKKAKK